MNSMADCAMITLSCSTDLFAPSRKCALTRVVLMLMRLMRFQNLYVAIWQHFLQLQCVLLLQLERKNCEIHATPFVYDDYAFCTGIFSLFISFHSTKKNFYANRKICASKQCKNSVQQGSTRKILWAPMQGSCKNLLNVRWSLSLFKSYKFYPCSSLAHHPFGV